MKIFGFSSGFCLVVLVSISMMVTTVSAGTTKEHKKKLLEKLRAALNTTTEVDAPIIPSEEELEKNTNLDADNKTIITSEEVNVFTSAEEEILDLQPSDSNKVEATEVAINSNNNYLAKFRTIFKRVLEMLGLRKEKRKDGRQNRMLELETNDVDHVPMYREEVRTTVGAVLGQKECIQKVACVSGSYLKSVKGKQLIFALLESFSPNNWKDTVQIVKRSAIHEDRCDFKCLES